MLSRPSVRVAGRASKLADLKSNIGVAAVTALVVYGLWRITRSPLRRWRRRYSGQQLKTGGLPAGAIKSR
jgi:hypothetical protein